MNEPFQIGSVVGYHRKVYLIVGVELHSMGKGKNLRPGSENVQMLDFVNDTEYRVRGHFRFNTMGLGAAGIPHKELSLIAEPNAEYWRLAREAVMRFPWQEIPLTADSRKKISRVDFAKLIRHFKEDYDKYALQCDQILNPTKPLYTPEEWWQDFISWANRNLRTMGIAQDYIHGKQETTT